MALGDAPEGFVKSLEAMRQRREASRPEEERKARLAQLLRMLGGGAAAVAPVAGIAAGAGIGSAVGSPLMGAAIGGSVGGAAGQGLNSLAGLGADAVGRRGEANAIDEQAALMQALQMLAGR